MITIHLKQSTIAVEEYTGIQVDTRKGKTYKDPIGPLCRLLRENGFHEDETVRVYRNGMQVFGDHALKFWADHDYYDQQVQGIRRVKYQPFKWAEETGGISAE